jgi:hypothetical protein
MPPAVNQTTAAGLQSHTIADASGDEQPADRPDVEKEQLPEPARKPVAGRDHQLRQPGVERVDEEQPHEGRHPDRHAVPEERLTQQRPCRVLRRDLLGCRPGGERQPVGARDRLGLAPATRGEQEGGRLRQVTHHQRHEQQARKRPDDEHRAPAEGRKQRQPEHRRGHRADVVAGHHRRRRLAGRPPRELRHHSDCRRKAAAKAEAREEAEERELHRPLREAAGERQQREARTAKIIVLRRPSRSVATPIDSARLIVETKVACGAVIHGVSPPVSTGDQRAEDDEVEAVEDAGRPAKRPHPATVEGAALENGVRHRIPPARLALAGS